MKIINLGEENSVLNKYICQLRDKAVQKDSMRLRCNLERAGEIFAYEISKTLSYKPVETETPLGIANCSVPSDRIVLGTIMRAGLPVHNGMLRVFDDAQNAFIATYRKYGQDNRGKLQLEYATVPSVEGSVLVISDAMIATGGSLLLAYQKLLESGEPLHTHIVSVIASADGVDYLSKNLPHKSVTLWVGAIDQELTNKSFIIPGMGDAGDLAFGSKY